LIGYIDLAANGLWIKVGGQGSGGTSVGSGSSAQQQATRKVTRMCITIATTFTVVWLPYQVLALMFVYGNEEHALLLLHAIKTLTYANSCVNPIVYALMWRPFRESLIQVLSGGFMTITSRISHTTVVLYSCRSDQWFSPHVFNAEHGEGTLQQLRYPVYCHLHVDHMFMFAVTDFYVHQMYTR